VVSRLEFSIPKGYLAKNDAAVLNIIAANKWKRPIYFTSLQAGLGFDNYIRQDGLTYRLVPVMNDDVNKDWVVDKMMNKFRFGAADVKGTYFDEENRRHLNSIRMAYATAATSLADNGRKEEAMKLLEKCDKGMLDETMPYGMISRGQQHDYFSKVFLEAAYKSGDTVLAAKVSANLKKELEQQMKYYAYLGEMTPQEFQQMLQNSMRMRYQKDRDQLYEGMAHRLSTVYDDAERGMQILNEIQRMELQYKSPKAVSPTETAPSIQAPGKPDSPVKH
jgi:hypothetical protein